MAGRYGVRWHVPIAGRLIGRLAGRLLAVLLVHLRMAFVADVQIVVEAVLDRRAVAEVTAVDSLGGLA